MSYFNGRMGKGAGKHRKGILTAERDVRDSETPDHRRKAFRLGPVPEGGQRTSRSIVAYLAQFVLDNGNTPENVAEVAERIKGV